MKIVIGFALLFVAFAADAFVLPDASEPQNAEKRLVPDISPVFIAPALANLLNDLGEINPEYLNQVADDAVPVHDAVLADAVKIVDLPVFENDAAPVDAVKVVDFPVAGEAVAPAVEDVPVVPVKVADLPVASADEDVPVDTVKVVDLPVASTNEAVAVDAVKVVDLPVAPVELPKIHPRANKDQEAPFEVDSVRFVDSPVEDSASFIPSNMLR